MAILNTTLEWIATLIFTALILAACAGVAIIAYTFPIVFWILAAAFVVFIILLRNI